MITLTADQRRALRAKAHHLDPVVSIGQHGLTATVLHEIDVALTAHGLVKVRAHSDDRAEREAMLARIVDELESASVQHLGKLLIVWRPVDEDRKTVAATQTRGVGRGTATRSDEIDKPTAARRSPQSTRGKSAPNPRRRRTKS